VPELVLYIGNRNYSSWSLRPWLVLDFFGISFREERIPLDTDEFRTRIASLHVAGRVPVLQHGDITVWESLAICEYLAETFAEKALWPRDVALRARARAIAGEMHSGFAHLRGQMPMNCRAEQRSVPMTEELQHDIRRVEQIWNRELAANEAGGPFLFGEFCIADAMFAPIVSRFLTYGIKPDSVARDYMQTMIELPSMQRWYEAARTETESLPWEEVGQ